MTFRARATASAGTPPGSGTVMLRTGARLRARTGIEHTRRWARHEPARCAGAAAGTKAPTTSTTTCERTDVNTRKLPEESSRVIELFARIWPPVKLTFETVGRGLIRRPRGEVAGGVAAGRRSTSAPATWRWRECRRLRGQPPDGECIEAGEPAVEAGVCESARLHRDIGSARGRSCMGHRRAQHRLHGDRRDEDRNKEESAANPTPLDCLRWAQGLDALHETGPPIVQRPPIS